MASFASKLLQITFNSSFSLSMVFLAQNTCRWPLTVWSKVINSSQNLRLRFILLENKGHLGLCCLCVYTLKSLFPILYIFKLILVRELLGLLQWFDRAVKSIVLVWYPQLTTLKIKKPKKNFQESGCRTMLVVLNYNELILYPLLFVIYYHI